MLHNSLVYNVTGLVQCAEEDGGWTKHLIRWERPVVNYGG